MLVNIAHLDDQCGRYQSFRSGEDLKIGIDLVLRSLQNQQERLEDLINGQDRKDQAALKVARSLSAINVSQVSNFRAMIAFLDCSKTFSAA